MQNEPQIHATLDLDALLHQLKRLVAEARVIVTGKALVDEEDFYICSSQIRKCAPRLFVNPNNQSFSLIGEIEALVENSKFHIFGRALVDRDAYLLLVAALSEAIAIERTVVENSSPQTQAEEIIRIAQMQAQSIIEQAQQEAQRIIENARRDAK